MASAATPAAAAGRHAPAAVYVSAVPLRGPKGPAQALMSAAYSLGVWDLQHFMVLLRPELRRWCSISSPGTRRTRSPPSPCCRRAKYPEWSGRGRCGGSRTRGAGSSGTAAVTPRSTPPTDLVIGRHDCRDYTNGLVEVLTGEKRVLDSIRSSAANVADQSV